MGVFAKRELSPEERAPHVIMGIICIFMLITAIILLTGVNNRSIAACRTWFIATLIYDILHFGSSIYAVVKTDTYYLLVAVLLGIILSWYLLYVVNCFIDEIRLYPLGIPAGMAGGGGGGMMISPQPSYYQPAYPTVNYSQANVNYPQYQQSAFAQPQYPPQFGQNLQYPAQSGQNLQYPQQPEVNTGTTPVPSGTAMQGQNSQ
ncbi:uncharacterized protein LOC118433398 [Folsomia candida]|uniref:uncharacterized protein LOC118433398 n=1 Tax=Folsomia candida TaxID=158441 RepID=UPI001604CBEF|nr:uncharacterized protein LOC118433398 [Folsomia candida]